MFKEVFTNHGYSESIKCDEIDLRYGFKRISDNIKRTGYLINMHSAEFLDEDRRLISALDLFFIQMDGTRFKYTVSYLPYFLICIEGNQSVEVIQYLKTKYGGEIAKFQSVYKEDLDLPNHLSGLKQKYLKLLFFNQNSLTKIRKLLMSAIKNNTERIKKSKDQALKRTGALDTIIDIREHDVPYHVRVSIDLKIFCGMWYDVEIIGKIKTSPIIKQRPDILERPEPVVLAFDIETTKLPLKFPDPQTDQIMMISYMIDGQGYLITNREIISVDVTDFEYTPKPEFEGCFMVFNESNEMKVIQRFFNHIMQIRPHIFVTYNGDFFDWPFIEIRASLHGLNMSDEIGFSKSRDGVYLSRPAIHMDCLCWVKRDSYLPVGSQGLKAVAKAKLRYDPIELDPEDMCKMAVTQPQILSNYSVSDAIATYFLYMKYVHPFIFALNTIIPMEPDEILRKGSGTLCETLLMVEAYHANIVYPNKQQNTTSKLSSDGHLIDSETYVGGHVEALECGVYRADIPCRFRLDRSMITQLIQSTEQVLEYAIVTEEGVPMNTVTNFQEISTEIKQALQGLYDIPNRLEQPVIYHLDVGAMYPNIILTNRLQPSAVVNDVDCAACDFNYPDAKCKRTMKWQWRGDMLPASKNELQRIKQQLEMERFPPIQVGGSQRAFHELSQEDQAAYEKKRLSDYCRKVYKKTKVVRLEERVSTICQKENSFYVDTVRAFRDRRYDYKGLTKIAKKAVSEAVIKGDAAEIKSAKSKEVLYDSLQLAHKCILNSFYGYVMRKGARWHSMPMAGIVCLTGSNIITKARNIIERIGRPLELDTDGIWCVLPASFPQVFTLHATYSKKTTFNISYPNAVLNNMVREHFTNDQYHNLVKVDAEENLPEYQIRSENSIFFEVDGPYLAMVLPAAKEEGKKLKKRYAVFNFDGSLAELKGFEVKRRGELQLIKNFQSSVFESFLSGNTLEECYANVAKIANYWLDVLYSRGQNLPDSELFELISENRSMSKKLEDYGAQKSTSISTAKRLAEFLGDQMVKDAGLACKYVISKKPDGSPVTERAIPLAIFQCEPSIRRHYLRRWLHDATMGDADIREVIDWSYYIERLSGAVQKIITIPAAMQGLSNPVPRVLHPDWLHKRMMGNNDKLKQRQITEIFQCDTFIKNSNRETNVIPIENRSDDICTNLLANAEVEKKTCTKRKFSKLDVGRSNIWRQLFGSPPPIGKTRKEIVEWVLFQKKKWIYQLNRKQENTHNLKKLRHDNSEISSRGKSFTISEFLKRSKKSLFDLFWEVIHVTALDDCGNFTVWAIVGDELHKIKLYIPRIFYVNQRSESDTLVTYNRKRVHCTLPRSIQANYIYKYNFQEKNFKCNGLSMIASASIADIEGVYETKISLVSRFLIEIGCLCRLRKNESGKETEIYSFEQLEKHADINAYLAKSWSKLKQIFLYQHTFLDKRQIWGLFLPSSRRAVVAILDKVRVNQMPNMNILYASERAAYLKKFLNIDIGRDILPEDMFFEVFMEVDLVQIYRHIQQFLCRYKEDKKGPTLLCTQTSIDTKNLKSVIPLISDFPNIKIHISEEALTLNSFNWQKQTTRSMIRHFLNFHNVVDLMLEQSRYLNIPIGNIPSDPVLIGTDIFFARLLQKNNFLLWWSTNNRPDLGGKESEDYKLLSEINNSIFTTQNKPGLYSGICVALTVQNLAISALLQSSKIQEMDGGHSATSFDRSTQYNLEDMLNIGTAGTKMNKFGSCDPAFRILRTMVNGWLREVSLNKNVFSDYHIAHFYRWVRSTNSFMFDPAICKSLTNLMKKVFLGIIAELERLGVVIIYADLNRIIINSKKKTVIEALSYIEFIVQSIRKKELYHSVQLSFDQSWDNLVWLDVANFAGVKCVLLPMERNSNDESEIDDRDISNRLDISFSLGSEISIVSEFKIKFDEFAALLVQSLLEKKSITVAIQNIADIVYGIVIDLHKKYGEIDPAGVSKYVQAVNKIVSINNDLDENILNFQRNLIKAIDINQFSSHNEFITCLEYVLNGVTCKACNEFRDIDLVKDRHRTMRDETEVWLCQRCFVAYENKEIETLISDDVTSNMVSYILQDIKCCQCNGIKKDNLSEMCYCGGSYVPLLNKEDTKRKLNTLLNVTKSHKMEIIHHSIFEYIK